MQKGIAHSSHEQICDVTEDREQFLPTPPQAIRLIARRKNGGTAQSRKERLRVRTLTCLQSDRHRLPFTIRNLEKGRFFYYQFAGIVTKQRKTQSLAQHLWIARHYLWDVLPPIWTNPSSLDTKHSAFLTTNDADSCFLCLRDGPKYCCTCLKSQKSGKSMRDAQPYDAIFR